PLSVLVFSFLIRGLPKLTLFPYTTLFRSWISCSIFTFMLMVIGSLGAATSMRGVQPDSSATTATVSTPALFFIVVPHFPCLSNRGEGVSPHVAQTMFADCPQSAGCARG